MVQGLIIAGIIAGSSLVTTQLMNDQKKTQKTAEVKDKLEEFHKILYTTLQHKQNCGETILKNNASIDIVGNSEIQLSSIYTYDSITCSLGGANCLVAQTGQTYMNNTVVLKSMTLAAPIGGTRVLNIRYWKIGDNAKAGKRIYGGNSIDKKITLRIQKNPTTSSFASCYAVTAASSSLGGASSELGNDIIKQMCIEMTANATGQKMFSWDEARSLCVLNAKCPYGQIYTGIDSTGDVKCRNIKDWMNFNDILDTTPANCPINANIGFVINNTTKKVRLSCGVCLTTCDCPGSFDVCESGICVNRQVGCMEGSIAKGDATCMWKCSSGMWNCPYPPAPCM